MEIRGWTAKEYVDEGVSGAKDRRPALDQLVLDARRRRFDVVVCWSLDRMGRSLKHLVILLDDLQALGVCTVFTQRTLLTRLDALQREIASIHQAFPDLRQRRSTAAPNPYTAGVKSAVAGVRGALEGAVTRRRPKISAQARKRIAEAQRKRWAEWRAEHAGTEGKEGASHARAKGGSPKKK